jgi:hypothetical protein
MTPQGDLNFVKGEPYSRADIGKITNSNASYDYLTRRT